MVPGSYVRQLLRARPALELLARVSSPTATPRFVDLGCRDGYLVPHLRKKWHDAHIVCVDADRQCLQTAMENNIDSNVEFVHTEPASWAPGESPELQPDVLFSSHSLHLVPDHSKLVPRLFSYLPPGGVFAMHAPMAAKKTTFFRTMCEVGADLGWGAPPPVQTGLPNDYFNLLEASSSTMDIWTTSYHHALDGAQGVAAFLRDSDLTTWHDYAEAQPGGASGEKAQEFVDAFTKKFMDQKVVPVSGKGHLLLETRVLFIVAQKSGHGPTEGLSPGLSQ
eukprot:TRINITY_DN57358_c0_g1_i1.p1 TRINITY_DN57358_c0_g1~~TRINITY_DN57358_c0_g1_i1.p1  ORF type:complete len:304 (+),score=75.59 TRINITY_DN57358_c0_g1_i1:77-913(+)